MKTKTLKLQFIPCSIYINIVDDVVNFRKSVIQKKFPYLPPFNDRSPNVQAISTFDEEKYFGQFWLTFPEELEFGVTVHEATHCVDAICETWGFEDTEFRAYLMTWIVEEINEML